MFSNLKKCLEYTWVILLAVKLTFLFENFCGDINWNLSSWFNTSILKSWPLLTLWRLRRKSIYKLYFLPVCFDPRYKKFKNEFYHLKNLKLVQFLICWRPIFKNCFRILKENIIPSPLTHLFLILLLTVCEKRSLFYLWHGLLSFNQNKIYYTQV